MKSNKKKILMSLLIGGLIIGLATPNIVQANGIEEVEEKTEDEVSKGKTDSTPETKVIEETKSEAADITSYAAPADLAFPASSQPLHDAILATYPAIDGADGSIKDNVISKSEAAAWTGSKIHIRNLGLTGTITGIENFTNSNMSSLYLDGNQFTGTIPVGIGNMTGLTILDLTTNQLSGSIPSEIGELENLVVLKIHANNLTGEIPTSIGNLSKLEQLNLAFNQLSGPIPEELGNCLLLRQILLHSNQLSGSIPESLGYLPLTRLTINKNNLSGEVPDSIFESLTLKTLELNDNAGLTGNPAEKIPAESSLEKLRVQGTEMNQAKPDVPTLSTFVGDDLASNLLNEDKTGPKDGLTQEEIDKAQESANWISDPIEKQEWQENIDLAQDMLDTKNAVDDLVDENGIINDDVTQEKIDKVQDMIDALPDGDFKNSLQNQVDDIQNQLKERNEQDAKDKVDDLFNPDGSIKDTTNQNKIDEAQDAVDKLPNGDLKNELQNKINEAQKQLEERDFVVLEGFKTFTGKGTVSAKIDAPIEKFSAVYVDGKLLPTSNYVVTNGSVVITLNEAYLNTLINGSYSVEIEFESGAKVSTTLTVAIPQIIQPPVDPSKPVLPEVPTSKPSTKPSTKPTVNGGDATSAGAVNTGDTTDLTMLYTMLATSFLGLVVVVKRRKEQVE